MLKDSVLAVSSNPQELLLSPEITQVRKDSKIVVEFLGLKAEVGAKNKSLGL